MMSNKNNHFDTIILGSGLGGSILANILAKHRARVLMIDRKNHPRFTIGEGMTPLSELILRLLSYQYSVPELKHLSSFRQVCKNISPSACGLKQHFGFLYHREGEEQCVSERMQFVGINTSHLFRENIDGYLVKTAIGYGAEFLPDTNVVDIETNEDGVKVETEDGLQFTADYLVDASGYNSVLARQLNLRENPTRLTTQSRSIFTHLVDVKNPDDCIPSPEEKRDSVSWEKGTLHHVFDGGWMWVIPFNNHEQSTNPVCSVGLNLDSSRFPKTDISPEQEFQNFISRFPSIASQFEKAKAIRPWVSTGRLQYSSHSCMGERFFILPHATGFVDPIFSVGFTQTFTTISPLASLILNSISDRDFSTEKFEAVARMQQGIFDYNDRVANCTYTSFTNFDLMNAWLRIWAIQEFSHVTTIVFSHLQTLTEKQETDLSRLTHPHYTNKIAPQLEGFTKKYVDSAIATVAKVKNGLISADEAADGLINLVASTSFPRNFFKLTNKSHRFISTRSRLAQYEMLRFLFWVKLSGKPEAKQFDFKIKDFIKFRFA